MWLETARTFQRRFRRKVQKLLGNQQVLGDNRNADDVVETPSAPLTTDAVKGSDDMADSDSNTATQRHSWFKFFPSDWKGDELLAMCSLGARGLLVELLCLMHRATPYGYLLVNGKPPSDAELVRLVRASSLTELRRLKTELLERGVLSVEGRKVYSRRMVRKGRQSQIGRDTGKRGGNPALTVSEQQPLTVAVNGRPNPPVLITDNTQRLEARNQTPISPSVLTDDTIAERAGAFLERYPAIFARVRSGAPYRVKEARDFPTACDLVSTYSDDRLDAMLEVFLLMDQRDCRGMNRPGTPNQFAHYAPECDHLLRKNGR
jgi:hypothetical protein